MSKTVTMILPARVDLHDDKSIKHSFGPGICEVPVEFSDHWFMKAHGAQKYDPAAKAAELLKEAEALETAAKVEAEKAEAAKAEAEKAEAEKAEPVVTAAPWAKK
jgi:hypothetical protein